MNSNENNYIVEIKNGFFRVFWHRHYFLTRGFCYAKRKFGKSYYYKNYITKEECNQYRKFCRIRLLKIYIYKREYTRSNNYRKVFLDNKSYNHKFTLCAYCGLPLRVSEITVDHIIPVHSVKKTRSGKFMIKLLNIKNVNEYRNLCAAHKRCNSKKGRKTGLWIIRGFLGKCIPLWIVRWILRITAFIYFTIFIIQSEEIGKYIQVFLERLRYIL